MKTLLISLSMLAAGQAALAQPWSFTKIVDTDTMVPGGTGTYTGFDAISIDSGRVGFIGSDSSFYFGVYDSLGGAPRKIADRFTDLPNANEKFQSDLFRLLPGTAAGGSSMSFFGAGTTLGGLYTHDGTSLRVLVDNSVHIPNSTDFFGVDIAAHDVHGEDAVFRARGMTNGLSGVYRKRGANFETVADQTMNPPNRSDLFGFFSSFRLAGASTFFSADTTSGYQAIYKCHGGVVSTIVDDTMSLPDGRRFSNPTGVRPDGDGLLFRATIASNHRVLATKFGDSIQLLVDDAIDPPGPSTSFNGINQFEYQNGTLVFGANDFTIYTNYGGSLQRVVGPGDIIDGKVVTGATFYEHGFDGTTAAFWVYFQGDSSFHYDRAICTVTIPTPGAAGLAAALVLSSRSRRRPAPRSVLRY
ncbi:MAG: hypothetical protein IT434_00215 [Phycisphaerales bacterium]|jgi:hypothetical protein|nr:hypothetical protein [Phycisphaerales bacterium]